ncbi:MAG TPA: tandem-95 repeat protein, partial [Candidatus Omnitrophota bacterium]|nr:tandem-95 repeat protein [Candidatus Omnitrophota bacterium]
DGGAGDDAAVFGGSVGDYDVDLSGMVALVTNRLTGETDTVAGIEELRFDDGSFMVSLGGDNVPVAVEDGFVLAEDTQLVIDPADLIANDADFDGDAISLTSVGGASHGTVQLRDDGKVVFTPDPEFSGQAGFSYTVTDATGRTSTASARVDVYATNDAPVALADAATVAEDGSVVLRVLDNDSDVDGDPLSVIAFNAVSANGGTVAKRSDGALVYTPKADFSGTDTFTYTMSDGRGGRATATATVTVTPVNDAPTAGADAFTTAEDTALVLTPGQLLGNDADVDGDTLAIAGTANATGGTVAVNSSGNLVFTPESNFNGEAGFDYTVADGNGGSVSQHVTVNVSSVNDAPVAGSDYLTTVQNAPVVVSKAQLLANDTDADGDALSIASHGGATGGTVSADSEGNLVFTPNAGFVGQGGFSYTVSDGKGGTATQTVSVRVNPINIGTPSLVGAGEFRVNTTTADTQQYPAVTVLKSGGFVATWQSANTDGSGWGIYAQRFDAAGAPVGGQFRVNGTVASDQFEPAVTALAGGGFVVAWDSMNQDGSYDGIYAQRFDANGNTQGGEFRVNTTTWARQQAVALTALNDGSFVATWHGYVGDGSSYNVYAQRYSAAGAPLGGEFRVNTYGTSDQAMPAVAALSTGGFVVTWASYNQDTSLYGIYAQRYDVNGNKVGGELAVNTFVANDQWAPVVTGLSDGRFVIAWNSWGQTGTYGYADVYMQMYDGGGNRIGSETMVNQSIWGSQGEPSVATLADGGFVVTYHNSGSGWFNVSARRYDASGTPVGGEMTVNTDFTGNHYYPSVAARPDGSFVTVWNGSGSGDADGIFGRVLAPNYAPVTQGDSFQTAEDTAIVIAASKLLINDVDPDGDAMSLLRVRSGTNGTASLDAAGNVVFTPRANFNGTATFYYDVRDSWGLVKTERVDVTVTPVNDAPTAAARSFTATEDQPLSGTLAGAGSDVDGDALTFQAGTVASQAGGSVAVNADGTFTYTPAANFNGTDRFTYTVADGKGGSATGTVTLTVGAVNDAPVAVADSYDAVGNHALAVDAAHGVLANDTDVDGNPRTVSRWQQTTAKGGTISMAADGSFTYSPPANYSGADSFTYWVTDGQGAEHSAVVQLAVAPDPAGTQAESDSYQATEDTALTVAAARGVLANDVDPQGDALGVTRFDAASAHGGTVAVNADGSFTYRPAADFAGIDSFTYDAGDGNSGTVTATVTITVAGVNDGPVAADDRFATDEGTPLEVAAGSGVLANDSDVDGDVLSVIDADAVSEHGGSVVMNADGSFTYTPAAHFSGIDHFRYVVSDGQGGSAWATAEVTVARGPHTPQASADQYASDEDAVLSVSAADGVLANDRDPDGDALSVVAHDQVTANGGIVTMRADGGFSYIPALDFHGVDSFNYTVSDAAGNRTTATVSITVAPVDEVDDASNRRLQAFNDYHQVAEDGELSVAVDRGVIGLKNRDADGNLVTVTDYEAVGSAGGSLVMNADGSFVYTPTADFNGAETFSYTIGNGRGATASASISVTVTPTNDAPEAVADAASGTEDAVLVLTAAELVGNDADIDGDTLALEWVGDAVHGTVALGSDGNAVFTPQADYHGAASFSYRVTDGQGGSAAATVTLDIAPANDAPVAGADSLQATEDAPATFTAAQLLGNDADPDGDALSLLGVGDAVNGTVDMVDGQVVFTPDADFNGTAGFDYTVGDGHGGTATARATVQVAAANDAPVASADSASATEDAPLVISAARLLGNDVDPDGDALTLVGVGGAVNGSVTLNAAGDVVFTPSADYHGAASFTYTVRDALGATSTATVQVDVAAVNDAPTVLGETVEGREDTALALTASQLLANDGDIDGDALSIIAVGNARNGQVAFGTGGPITFTPDRDFHGTGSFDYVVGDGKGGVRIATATVAVASVNDAPTAAADSVTAQEDTSLVLAPAALLGNDRDPEGQALSIVSVGAARNGTVIRDAQGNVIFTPNADFNGVAAFEYVATDGAGGETVGTVSVAVTAVQDAPVVAGPLTAATSETAPFTADLLAGASDVDASDTLAVTGLVQTGGRAAAFTQVGNSISLDPAQFTDLAVGEQLTLTFGYGVSDG